MDSFVAARSTGALWWQRPVPRTGMKPQLAPRLSGEGWFGGSEGSVCGLQCLPSALRHVRVRVRSVCSCVYLRVCFAGSHVLEIEGYTYTVRWNLL
jgi:hypothetical protein